MKKRKFKVPHTLVFLFSIVVLAQILSYMIPAGSFERVENAAGRLQVVPGSFHLTPETPALSPMAFLTAIPKGFSGAHEIIFFVFIIGGAFAVLRSTGAVDAGMRVLLRRWGDRPFWLVAGGTTLFAVGSSTIGFGEEYFPFVPVLISLTLVLGYALYDTYRPGHCRTPAWIGALVPPGDDSGLCADWYSSCLAICQEGGAGPGGKPGSWYKRARRTVDLQWRRWRGRGRPSSDDHHAQVDPDCR